VVPLADRPSLGRSTVAAQQHLPYRCFWCLPHLVRSFTHHYCFRYCALHIYMRASWLMIDRTVGHRCAGSSNAAEVAILSAHDLASKAVLRGHRDLVFASQFVSNTHLVTGMLGRCALSVVNLNHRLNHPMQAPGTARFVCGMCRHWLRPIDQTLAPAQRRCRVFSLPPSLASSIVAKFVPCRSIATCRYAQQSAPPFVRNLPHQPTPTNMVVPCVL
jgi:hypothetical protein